ncbi:hypothetical protein J4219_05740 [Candidatus Woesearchaeota archaeon]|nr:hypothetical protein [Candidatus Woesearchaeota archaeon]
MRKIIALLLLIILLPLQVNSLSNPPDSTNTDSTDKSDVKVASASSADKSTNKVPPVKPTPADAPPAPATSGNDDSSGIAQIQGDLAQFDRAFVYFGVDGTLQTATTPLPPSAPGTAAAPLPVGAPAAAEVHSNGAVYRGTTYLGMQVPASVLPDLVRAGGQYDWETYASDPEDDLKYYLAAVTAAQLVFDTANVNDALSAQEALALAKANLREAELDARNPVILRIPPEHKQTIPPVVTIDEGTLVSNKVETTTETLVHSDGSVTRITEQDVSSCGLTCDESKSAEFTLRSRTRNVDRTQTVILQDEDGNDVSVPITLSRERSVNNIPLVGRGIEEFGSSETLYWEPTRSIPPPIIGSNGAVTNQDAIDAAITARNDEIQAERDKPDCFFYKCDRNQLNREVAVVHKDANGDTYLVYDPETDAYYLHADNPATDEDEKGSPLTPAQIDEARDGAAVNVNGQSTEAKNVLFARSRMERNEERAAARSRSAFGLFGQGDVWGGLGRLMKIYNQYAGLTQLSNLIWDKNAKEVEERRTRMIQEFCLAGGIENCLVSTICGQIHEITPSNVIAGRGPSGQFVSSGVINAERSFPIDIRGLSRQQLIDILGRNITTINGIRVDLSNPAVNLSRFGNITLRLYHVQVSVTNNVAGEKDLRYNVELRRTGAGETVQVVVPATGTTPATIEEGEVEFPTAYAEPISQAKLFKKEIVLKPTESTPPDKRHEYFNSFAQWDTACLLVQPGLPKGSAFDSSFGREFCTPIVEYQGGPTTIDQQDAQPPAGTSTRQDDDTAI